MDKYFIRGRDTMLVAAPCTQVVPDVFIHVPDCVSHAKWTQSVDAISTIYDTH